MKWMNKVFSACLMIGFAGLSVPAFASEAETSATAGSRLGRPNGNAAATARYEGDIGFARTESRSGPISTARGVAVGVDEDGLSLSISHAIAGPVGPALAANFNLSIGADGSVSTSVGRTVANGPFSREASAGGATRTSPFGSNAVSVAEGRTDSRGRVDVVTRASNHEPRIVRVNRGARVVERGFRGR